MSRGFTAVKNPDCNISVGGHTTIGENVVLGPSCQHVEIGFGCWLGRDLYIDVEYLRIGDYCTIHHGGILHGIRTVIGHNCWIGHYVILDSLGGDTRLGNNVGVGAHSQLWSHMKFGDVLAGCRWNSSGPLILEDDVWLVGHTVLGPIHAGRRAMLMTGSVAVKDMAANHIYAGSPATDMTARFGTQFEDRSLPELEEGFERLRVEYEEVTGRGTSSIVAVKEYSDNNSVTQFNLQARTYRPRYTEDEFKFMKFLLYDRAKFVPTSA